MKVLFTPAFDSLIADSDKYPGTGVFPTPFFATTWWINLSPVRIVEPLLLDQAHNTTTMQRG